MTRRQLPQPACHSPKQTGEMHERLAPRGPVPKKYCNEKQCLRWKQFTPTRDSGKQSVVLALRVETGARCNASLQKPLTMPLTSSYFIECSVHLVNVFGVCLKDQRTLVTIQVFCVDPNRRKFRHAIFSSLAMTASSHVTTTRTYVARDHILTFTAGGKMISDHW